MRRLPLLLATVPLLAQQQPTFHAAWQDGLEAERGGRWAEAAAAYRRALELRPESAARVVIYGNNLLFDYYPRTHLARCLVELGDLGGAEAELRKADREPAEGREALAKRLHELRARKAAAPASAEPTLPHPSAPQVPAPGPEPVPPKVEARPVTEATPGATPSPEAAPAAGLQPESESPRPAGGSPPSIPQAPVAGPAPEPPRPLPWMPVGLGAGLVLLAVWLWSRRSPGSQARLGRGTAPFTPGGLPATVGPYRIERLLGRGGFADTFLARHRRTGREVALKVPHLHRADDAEFRARFLQEARIGARLDHPNLVRIIDPGPETGRPYLAMEYLPGRTLDERLTEAGPLPIPEAVAIAAGVAGAMAHAHVHGVVHRDLKPANIMLTGMGPKVMDLGIARVMDADTVTTTYAFLGTPLYSAPEVQVRTHVGPAADRYSLGIILFHMLAGAPPFQGRTPFEILERHRHAAPPDLRSIRPDVPPALARLVARLLDKEPDQRPEDGEILRVLAEVETGFSAPPAAGPRD